MTWPCGHCATPFEAQRFDALYCSMACRQASYRVARRVTCPGALRDHAAARERGCRRGGQLRGEGYERRRDARGPADADLPAVALISLVQR
jgi:hypothetical protein